MNFEVMRKILVDAVANGELAGVTAAVTNGSETLFQASAGTTAIGAGEPVTEDTLFWIASMTKPVTSIAAMQLVEQGKLSLDAPIGDVLPKLAHPQILHGGELRPATRPITLRHLLNHTAGYSYPFASAEYAALIEKMPVLPTPGSRASLNAPLLFEPGERWEYGISTDWVGLAVEAVSGLPLDVYFRRHILDPLGMYDTVFMPDAGQLNRRMALHQRQADGTLVAYPNMPPQPTEVLSGGGGLYSTVADYLKFLRMLLNRGAGIVTPETLAEMSRNQIGGLRAGLLPAASPAMGPDRDVNPGQDNKWGLGFLIYPQTGPFGRNAGSLSWSGMANTYFWINPVAGLAAMFMTNILPPGDVLTLKAYAGLEKAVYAAAR